MTGSERVRHPLVEESCNADEVLLVCPVEGCGRRLVLHLTRAGYTSIDRGDPDAYHSWSSSPDLLITGIEVAQ